MNKIFLLFSLILIILLYPAQGCQQAISPKEPELRLLNEKIYRDENEGFEIAYPGSWRISTKEAQQSSSTMKFLFYAVDPESKTDVLPFAGSFSVSKYSLDREITLSTLQEAQVKAIEADPNTVKPVSAKLITLTNDEAIELRHTKNLPNRKGPVVFIQHSILKDKKIAYVLTSETEPGLVEKYGPIYESMARSFRFLGK